MEVTGAFLFAVMVPLASLEVIKPKPTSAQEDDRKLCFTSFGLLGDSDLQVSQAGLVEVEACSLLSSSNCFSWIPG